MIDKVMHVNPVYRELEYSKQLLHFVAHHLNGSEHEFEFYVDMDYTL